MQDLEIWKSYGTRSSESPMGDTTAEISFLVNGCDVSSVSASRYIAVLPFAYFPSLHAVALEFPLDVRKREKESESILLSQDFITPPITIDEQYYILFLFNIP